MRFDFDAYGSAFFTMRLHRLRVLLTEQCDIAFLKQGVVSPSPCTSVVLFLAERGGASIAQISRATGYSHQLVNQRLALLEELGLSQRLADPHDKRKCTMELTRRGKADAKKLIAALESLARAFDELFDDLGVDVGAVLDKAHAQLSADPLQDRMQTARTPRAPGRSRTRRQGAQE